MAEKVIYAMYDDDDVLKDGAKKLVAKGVKVADVFSPFPIHGIGPIIGVKHTRLGIMAFVGLFEKYWNPTRAVRDNCPYLV